MVIGLKGSTLWTASGSTSTCAMSLLHNSLVLSLRARCNPLKGISRDPHSLIPY